MNFTQFQEVYLQNVCFHCNRPNGPKYANTEKKQDLTKVSWRNNVYTVNFSEKTRVDHAYAIE